MQPIAQVPNCNRILQSCNEWALQLVKKDGGKKAFARRSGGGVKKFPKIRVLTVATTCFSRPARAKRNWFRSLRAIFHVSPHAKIFRCKRHLQRALRARMKSRKTGINPEKPSWP